MRTSTVIFVLTFVFSTFSSAEGAWWRGNTHAHSNLSDGTSAPADVAARYDDLGYDFLFLTDHNALSGFAQYSTSDFLCIEGEEITSSGRRHVNGLGLTSRILPGTIQGMVDAVHAQGGLAHLNHPTWSGLTAAAVYPVEGLKFMEIYNALTGDNDESIWDEVLSMGKRIYGLATDDCHSLYSQSGKAWIMVRAPDLSQSEILGAMDSGEFYASNGVVLDDYAVLSDRVMIDSQDGVLIEFIGFEGEILTTVAGSYAEYFFTGSEAYVRARITNAQHRHAWTQPVFEPIPEPILLADFDQDGDVDSDDFIRWQIGFGDFPTGGAQKSDGDYDNDGDVDGDDFLGWQAEFGSAGGAAFAAVPEPSTFALTALTFLVTLGSAVRKSRA